MKRAVSIAVLSLLGAAAVLAQGGDDAALRARADEFVAAWNSHDTKAMTAVFAPDATLINPYGRVATGRPAIEQLFTDEHTGPMKASTFTIDRNEIKMLSPTVAVQDWEVTLSGLALAGSGSGPDTLKHHVTTIAVKKDGKWWVEATRAFTFAAPPAGMAGMHH
jgi:uncharacterized protein (TIGR02246 family)